MILSSPSEWSPLGHWLWEGHRQALLVPSLLAVLGYALSAWRGDAALNRTAWVVAWLAHAVAIGIDVFDWGGQGVGARFGFAPALSATAWMVLMVYTLESRFEPQPQVRRWLALLGGAAVAVAYLFPGEFRTQAGSPWAPVHWVLGLASYGLFGAAVFHAALLGRADQALRPVPGQAPQGLAGGGLGLPLLKLERLTFQFVAAGFAVLSAALVLGAWFASPWRWDHKTLLSVLSWLVFAGLLLGRHRFGWRGARAMRWLYAGAGLLLLAYVGTRFVFEVLLQRAAGG
jgi:ABC-type uncharacterized transport system permease subunit